MTVLPPPLPPKQKSPDSQSNVSEGNGTKPEPAKQETVIHVIPEQFYGAGLKTKAPKLKPIPASQSTPLPPSSVNLPTNNRKTAPGTTKKRSRLFLIILIIGIVLLLGVSVVAVILLSPPKQPVIEQPPITNVPLAPVCGNGQCETGEDNASCAVDCPAPAPICGNAVCEDNETSELCPLDCAPAASVCGDGRCEGSETIESCRLDCAPPAPTAGRDSDSDGLTDEEERLVYGTNFNDPNSDKDSFVDLNEVLNLFDPVKPSPAELQENAGIAVHTSDGGLRFFHPASWDISFDESARVLRVNAPSGESVVFIREEKDPTQSLVDWYLSKFPGAADFPTEIATTRRGLRFVTGADKSFIFVESPDGSEVHTAEYALGERREVQYQVTFQMIIQSLEIGE